jgi:hypothetical protein
MLRTHENAGAEIKVFAFVVIPEARVSLDGMTSTQPLKFTLEVLT